MDRMRGPMNPSTNDSCGLLVDSFDSPPVLMMTYNPPYYLDLYDKANLFSSWVEKYPFPIICLGAKRPGSSSLINLFLYIKASIRFFVYLMTIKIDVIETFTIHSNIFGIPIAFLAGIPVRIPT